ncbi:GGDEF domain-containing protein [Terriglobus roseus]|nr:GGDEF domain-containing protein [Terriglobus roseus]
MLLILTNAGMYRGIGGVGKFLLYNVCLLIAAIAVLLRGQIPDPLSIVGATGTFFVGYYVLMLGLEDLFGRRRGQRFVQAALVVLGLIAVVQYGVITPNTSRRLLLFSLVLGLQQWNAAGVILFQSHRAKWKMGLPMAVMLFLLGCGNFVRLVGIHSTGAPSNYLESGFFLQSIVIFTTCLQCGIIVAYVWITMALLRQDLEVQASTDSLTGLLNRRAIEVAANRELQKLRRKSTRVCALAMDLDAFKGINDEHGHRGGDAALVAVANCLRSALRPDDLAARVGGDEFLVILPATNLAMAEVIAEKVRTCVADLEISHEQAVFRVTTSVGFAELTDDSSASWDQLMTHCDRAMYAVKRSGGNQALTTAV